MSTFSGDLPITTFFSSKSLSAGRKRKVEPQTTVSSSSKIQKREKPQTKATGSREETSFARGNLAENFSNAHAHLCGDEGHSRLPPDTPSIKFSKKQKAVVALQTPPTTIERSRRRNTRTREATNKSCTSLPTPTTLPRSQLRQPQRTTLKVNDTPYKPTNNFIPTPSPSNLSRHESSYSNPDFPDSPQSCRYIPSSQSQDGPESQLPGLSVSLTPRRRSKYSPNLSIALSANPQISTTPRRSTRSLRFPSAADYDRMVFSSQSQLFDPFDTSPRRERSSTAATKTGNAETLVEKIPSSQAHEIELMAPTKDPSISYLQHQDSYQHSPSSLAFPNHRAPPRTLSDELFSVPIKKNVLAGIFTKKESSNLISYDEASASESETESETENEGEDTNTRSSNSLTTSKISEQVQLPPLSGNLQHHGPIPSQQLSQFSLGSSSASLPHPLVDFEDMFGSNDESYPPDFPMSLRI